MDYGKLLADAQRAGMEAAAACRPVPMVVRDRRTGEEWIVDGGPCGFAWIWFAGNTAFGRYAKRAGYARSAYPNGLQIWIGEHGQSMEKKAAHATAFAEVLRASGVKAYAHSRMD